MTPRGAIPVAVVSGALLTLAFPEPDVWPLAWVATAPVLYATRGVGAARGALVWTAFAVAFFGTLLSWISIVGWLAWGVLLVVEAPFVAAFGALWGALSGRTGTLGRIALAAGAWATFEYLRSIVPLGGFTWGQLAQSQHNAPVLLAWAGVGGGVMLAGIIVATNAALAELLPRPNWKRVAMTLSIVAVVVGGGYALSGTAGDDARQLRVALVQGDVDPTVPQDFEKDLRIFVRHVELTEGIDEPVDLVVWPESAAAIDPDNPVVLPLLERAATAVDAPMIIGGSEDVDDGHDRYRVMAFLVASTGEIVDSYQKTHLVPFGEYVPARDLLDWMPILEQIPRDAVPGTAVKIFETAGTKIATVLSFEGDFGSLVRARVGAGGRVLIVATNTSTWHRSWASAQHVAFSQVRAAENGVPAIHAALSGISAVIDEHGRIERSLPLFERGVIVRDVAVDAAITPYAKAGDWILLGFVVLCLGGWEIGRRKMRAVASRDA